MRLRKYLAALLALCLLLALVPAATTEVVEVVAADELPLEVEAGDIVEEMPEEEESPDAQPLDDVDLGGPLSFEIEDPVLEGAGDAVANADTSLVKITKPASGETMNAGRVALWCTFVNENPTGGFSAGDTWKYYPMRVQVLKDDALISDDTITNYSQLTFTDEGQQYATLYLMEAGTYTIRTSVPGSPDYWDCVKVTVVGSSITPAPVATRAPITEDNCMVITSPAQGEKVMYDSIPVKLKYQPRWRRSGDDNYLDASDYNPIHLEVLNDRGKVVYGLETETSDTEGVLEEARAQKEWLYTTVELSVGGNYTIRVRTSEDSSWDSVQVYAVGPAYPVSKGGNAHTVTPGVSQVTIDLAKDKVARIPFDLKTGLDPDAQNYIYYSDYVEDGDDTIRYKALSDYKLEKSGDCWTADGWIEYEGVKVGSTTLHMYILVNGTRYDHHAVTVNVIDSSKVSAVTPASSVEPGTTVKPTATPKPGTTVKPTATPKPGTTAAPATSTKVNLSDCEFAVKDQVYSGKARTPAVTVKYGTRTLKKGTDYAVAYKNNKAIGTATATVTGKGKYTGTKKVTFSILPKGTAQSKPKAAKKAFTAKWKKQKNITGYEVQYGLKADFSDAKTKVIKKAKTTSVKIKKLKAKKKYYIRVRTYKTVKKVKYYSAWSKTKTVKTK